MIDEKEKICRPAKWRGDWRTKGSVDFTYQNDDEKRRRMEKAGLVTPGDMGYFDETDSCICVIEPTTWLSRWGEHLPS